jgi:hypothetical protein
MSENAAAKARRLLSEGRLRVVKCGDPSKPGLIVASCRGDSGEIYNLGFDPDRKQWRCQCAAKGKCSHVQALQLVAVRHD